jgi:hypothetical protein
VLVSSVRVLRSGSAMLYGQCSIVFLPQHVPDREHISSENYAKQGVTDYRDMLCCSLRSEVLTAVIRRFSLLGFYAVW